MSDISTQQAQQILSFLQQRINQQIGDGECYTSVHTALGNANLKSAPDYGRITPTADYVWGREIRIEQARAGDVIQFRNFKVTITTRTDIRNADGSSSWNESTETHERGRPNHSAVIGETGSPITLLESNVNNSRQVQRNLLQLINAPTATSHQRGTDGSETTIRTTVSVTGSYKIYRPQTR